MHNMTWADAYAANFKKLQPFEVECWEAEMRERISDLREGEALKAVRTIAELVRTGQWKLRQMVSANHVISVIIRNRYEARTAHLCPPMSRQDEFLAYVKGKMRAANAFYMRWNIMCSPDIYAKAPRTTTAQECDILNAWAREMWDDWHRPTLDEIAAFQE
jgi:hypothetical protein